LRAGVESGFNCYTPFLEPLHFQYYASPRFLHCLEKNGRKAYEIEFHEHPPAGGLALTELVTFDSPTDKVLDIGTGSGVIAVGIACKNCSSIYAVDISATECNLALRNVLRNSKDKSISVVRGNLASAFIVNAFAVVISNPPQLPTNDSNADVRDFAGPTGYEAIDMISSQSKNCLIVGGKLWLYVLGFLGVEERTGEFPSLFERLRSTGFEPHVVCRLRRRISQSSRVWNVISLIRALYPLSDLARNYPNVQSYDTFVVQALLINK